MQRSMTRINSGGSGGGEYHSDIEGDPHPPLPPQPQDRLTSTASNLCGNMPQTQTLPQHDGIVNSTLRSHHASLASSHSAGPEEFMDGLLNEVEKKT